MPKQHSLRPEKLRKGKSWMCACGAINLYEAVQCKMINVEALGVAIKQEQAIARNLGIAEPKPKREKFKLSKSERNERSKMLELFTGPIRGD